ncbi:MAG: pyrroline-5-carboxylate reductase [Planctomycetales bacterium]|nr:pyrroline-5-carboxylate reductase [Planctomycetales bacterium]
MANKKTTLGFIGAGQMAKALAGGFVRAGLVAAEDIWAADPSPASRDAFAQAVPGCQFADSNRTVAQNVNVLVLAVKPQYMNEALASVRGAVGGEHLVISIAAGVPLAALAAGLGETTRLVRVMPNTPCLVGQAASGFSANSAATEADRLLVAELIGAVGRAFAVDEKLLDAVTGLSGSGPAFVYVMIEALADGGVQMGLPRDVAAALAAQTVRGAAEMVLSTGEHPAALKDKVASPGGTTIAGLAALEAAGVRPALIGAVRAATERSVTLGQEAQRAQSGGK